MRYRSLFKLSQLDIDHWKSNDISIKKELALKLVSEMSDADLQKVFTYKEQPSSEPYRGFKETEFMCELNISEY